MKFKRDKGFRKIEIFDVNSEGLKNTFSDYKDKKCNTFFIVILIILCIFILIDIFYLLYFYEDKTDINNNTTINDTIINNNITKENFNKTIKENKISSSFINDTSSDYNKYEETKGIKISIIVIDNNNIEKLLESINEQNFTDIEIIIVDDNISYNLIYDQITKNDTRIKLIRNETIIGKLKKRIEGIKKSNGEYIIFFDSDDYFSSPKILNEIYNIAIKDKVDILQFKTYHDKLPCKESIPIKQPQIFDMMYFGEDNFNYLKQFHINGKLIKRKLFINVLNYIDNFYKEQNMNNYEQSMLLFILFKKAESFIYLKIEGTNKGCSFCDRDIKLRYISNLKYDFLIYLNFMTQYSSDNVPEKRMISYLFIEMVINRHIIYNGDYYNLLKQIIDFFLKSEKISDDEKNTIKEYQKKYYMSRSKISLY